MNVTYEERIKAQDRLNNSKMMSDYRESIELEKKALQKNIERLERCSDPVLCSKLEVKIAMIKEILSELNASYHYLSEYYVRAPNPSLVIKKESYKTYNIKDIVMAYRNKKL